MEKRTDKESLDQPVPIGSQNYFGFQSDYLTDKFTGHKAYLQFYSKLFEPIKDNITDLLEIGVDHGGALIMWKNYFPNVRLTGVDIYPKPLSLKNEDTIRYFQMNAYSTEAIRFFLSEKYDVIIDDGPHDKESQIISVNYLPYALKQNGILIVEDVQSEQNAYEIMNSVPRPFIPSLIDLRSINNQPDDIIIIVALQKYNH